MNPTAKSLVLTQGDPCGVGPELLLQLAAAGALRATDIVVADPRRLEHLASTVPASWAGPGWDAVRPLVLDGSAGIGQVEALRRGVDVVLDQPDRALVTAPIDKAAALEEGLGHPGHTEYLAQRAGGAEVAMAMIGPTLRLTLATIHLPLREVPDALTTAGIERAGRLLAEALHARFGVDRPRVAVLGLNPHAGEQGVLGHEEAQVISPAIALLQRRFEGRASFFGPLPADAAFHAHHEGQYDGLVAMYHDQGLAPFKLVHFRDGVNMTLGLPFVRTSPDHGTARDIAGRGVADPSSMLAATRLARGVAA